MEKEYLIREKPLKSPAAFCFSHDHRKSVSAVLYHGRLCGGGKVCQ